MFGKYHGQGEFGAIDNILYMCNFIGTIAKRNELWQFKAFFREEGLNIKLLKSAEQALRKNVQCVALYIGLVYNCAVRSTAQWACIKLCRA